MAYICHRCNEAHRDGRPCPYMNTIQDNPEGLKIEKIERMVLDQDKRLKKIEDLFRALRSI